MITHPTTRQPWLHALLVLTLSILVCYSFTTARAVEKEVPAKVREGETIKKPTSDADTPVRKGESKREGSMKKNRERERDSGTKKTRARDDEDGVKKPGTDDGEKPRTGQRDGVKKPGGERDGEGRPSAEGGTKPRRGDGNSAAIKSSKVITMHVTANGDTVLINGEKQPISGLRGHLSTFLLDHPGAKVIVSGDPDTPLKSLHETADAVRDNGNKNVGIKAE